MDEDAIRDRAHVDRAEPPLHGLEEAMWMADDPETGCVGFGRVRAEAVGNLVAVVAHAEDADPTKRYAKMPGRIVERWDDDRGGGVLSELSRFLTR